jgi:hypothetical protein
MNLSSKLEGLGVLLKAPSKAVVDKILQEVFKTRSGKIQSRLTYSLVNALSITEEQAESVIFSFCWPQFVESARFLLKIAVYENSSNLGPLFPEKFHKDLKALILQIIEARLPQWRESASSELTFLPKLKEFDWRVDVKRASDATESMSVPTVIVQLKVWCSLNLIWRWKNHP